MINLDEKNKDIIKQIAESLLECEVDEAIRDYLTLAATDCLCPRGKRYQDVANPSLTQKAAEQILGWLVLASIDEAQIEQILPDCSGHDSLFFTLAVDSFAGVEIVLSRRFEHQARWEGNGNATPDPTGQFFIPADDSWLVHDKSEAANKILSEIWNKVFNPKLGKEKKADQALTKVEIKQLNAALRQRRVKRGKPEHYYIAFKLPEIDSGFAEIIYRHVLNRLPQMTVVQFGLQDAESLFVLPEEEITIAISEFYRDLES